MFDLDTLSSLFSQWTRDLDLGCEWSEWSEWSKYAASGERKRVKGAGAGAGAGAARAGLKSRNAG